MVFGFVQWMRPIASMPFFSIVISKSGLFIDFSKWTFPKEKNIALGRNGNNQEII